MNFSILLFIFLLVFRGEVPQLVHFGIQDGPETAIPCQGLPPDAWQQPEHSRFLCFLPEFFWFEQSSQKYYVKYPLWQGEQQLLGPDQWRAIDLTLSTSYIPMLHPGTHEAWNRGSIQADTMMLQVLDLGSRQMESFTFGRHQARWYLQEMGSSTLEQYPDQEFIEFLVRFSADEAFQMKTIEFPLEYYLQNGKFVTDSQHWHHQNLTAGNILMLMQTPACTMDSPWRNVLFIGIENEIDICWTFHRNTQGWMLVSLVDMST